MRRRNKSIKQESEGNRVSSSGEPSETGFHDYTLGVKSPLLLATAPSPLGARAASPHLQQTLVLSEGTEKRARAVSPLK